MFLNLLGKTDIKYTDGTYYSKYLCTRCSKEFLQIAREVYPRGNTVSCGCYRKAGGSLHRKGKSPGNALKDPQESSFNGLYSSYRVSARYRNLDFLLTKEQFRKLTDSLCHYCGNKPDTAHKHKWSRKLYVHNGIDRKDNTIGYTTDNCLPCCSKCNYLKGSKDYDMFIDHVLKIGRWVGKL